jgi:hypothetical protein
MSEAIVITDAMIEEYIRDRAARKFNLIEAEVEAKVIHRKEIRSWAKVASHALWRQHVYKQRTAWVLKVLKSGLLDKEQAYELAAVKYPF